MLALELDEFEVDYCDNCGGVWLDSGELELALGTEAFREDQLIPLADSTQSGRSKRNCPICSKHMALVSLPDHTTELDRCERGHGLWFDKDELRQVAEAISLEGSGQVMELLKEILHNE
jgi:Zn-finger nucleic acid-binding protein